MDVLEYSLQSLVVAFVQRSQPKFHNLPPVVQQQGHGRREWVCIASELEESRSKVELLPVQEGFVEVRVVVLETHES